MLPKLLLIYDLISKVDPTWTNHFGGARGGQTAAGQRVTNQSVFALLLRSANNNHHLVHAALPMRLDERAIATSSSGGSRGIILWIYFIIQCHFISPSIYCNFSTKICPPTTLWSIRWLIHPSKLPRTIWHKWYTIKYSFQVNNKKYL